MCTGHTIVPILGALLENLQLCDNIRSYPLKVKLSFVVLSWNTSCLFLSFMPATLLWQVSCWWSADSTMSALANSLSLRILFLTLLLYSETSGITTLRSVGICRDEGLDPNRALYEGSHILACLVVLYKNSSVWRPRKEPTSADVDVGHVFTTFAFSSTGVILYSFNSTKGPPEVCDVRDHVVCDYNAVIDIIVHNPSIHSGIYPALSEMYVWLLSVYKASQ